MVMDIFREMPQYSETLEEIVKSGCLTRSQYQLADANRRELALICMFRHFKHHYHDSRLKFTCTVQWSSKTEPMQSNIRRRGLSDTQHPTRLWRLWRPFKTLISILINLISRHSHAINFLCEAPGTKIMCFQQSRKRLRPFLLPDLLHHRHHWIIESLIG